MTEDPKPSSFPPSFSTARRWKIGLDTVLRTLLVLAVVGMVNYVGFIFSRQYYLSPQTRIELSPRTVGILKTLTNRIDVTVYYDKRDQMYPTIMALLNEYHRLDPHLNVRAVDYLSDPGTAAQIKDKYKLMTSSKNLVIFDCQGKVKVAPGDNLSQLGAVGVTKEKKIEFAPVAFNGEKMFTSMLLSVTRPQPFKAYFLQGDGEPSLEDTGDNGYSTFANYLREDFVDIEPITLRGDYSIPPDSDLLIIAGARKFSDPELTKIDHYLQQGGRLFVLFNYNSSQQPTGLEDVLAHWGVNVGSDNVRDPANAVNSDGTVMEVQNFSPHPVVNALAGQSFVIVYPRPVGSLKATDSSTDPLTVTELAFTSDQSVLYSQRGAPSRPYPVMVAVEQNSSKSIAPAGGSTRIVVVGDSMCLANQLIKVAANSDFAGYAVNWLLDRPILLTGIGQSPVVNLRLTMTQTEMRNVRWILIAALPCAVLVFGWLVWLRRRK
ncbi:MAG TPA: DUF4350 domain-containing protein [Pseudomonadales bacterium]|nr:DUF4350 domain-containing protein [Pseudomonadales bacterium]